MRKAITAIWTLWLATRASVRGLRRTHAVPIVPVAAIYKSGDELSNWPQINCLSGLACGFVHKHTLKLAAQTHRVRRLRNVWAVLTQAHLARHFVTGHRSVNFNIHVVRLGVFVPAEADPTVVLDVARVPL